MLPMLFLFPGSFYWIMLQMVVWVCHGCLLFYVYRRKNRALPLYAHPESSHFLFEPSPIYRTDMDDTMFADLYEKLQDYFEKKKPYLRSKVNVSEVANGIYSNRAYLSRLLNEKLNLNFNQFVNSYRIKEAQRLVTEEGPLALSELCKKVGFTSMASFTVAFKLNTGMTPGEWCKKQKRLS